MVRHRSVPKYQSICESYGNNVVCGKMYFLLDSHAAKKSAFLWESKHYCTQFMWPAADLAIQQWKLPINPLTEKLNVH